MGSQILPDTEKKSARPSRWRSKRTLRLLILVFAVAACVCVLGLVLLIAAPGPDLAVQTHGISVLDRKDRPVALLKSDRTLMPVPLSRISKHLPKALVAAEDRNFYAHPGVDPIGIVRALIADAEANKMIQGGSTITQQLVKNLYFEGRKRTLTTKLREALMALQIDRRYSKDQIIEAYLNNVYFGSGAYGAEEAAQRYFSKSASALNLQESAYLAGLVNAPSVLSVHKKEAIARQRAILDNMTRFKLISTAAAETAKKTPLKFLKGVTPADECSYYLIYVREQLEEKLDPDLLYHQGVRAYTNLDVTAQRLAARALTQGIRKAPKGVSQGALISMSVADGSVVAMVGGAGSFQSSPWNRALNPHTAGSAFKPFVYLAGIVTGKVQPNTMLDDAPIAVSIEGSAEPYIPKNFDGEFLGPMTVRKALALSRNICAVRVGEAVGPEKIVEVAKSAGITSELKPTISLSLGASAVSPIDMATAYATLARGGIRIDPMFIRKITTLDNKIIEQAQPQAQQVFETESVAELVDMLQDVVEKGTATRAKLFGRPVAGKTGTADGARDIWFVGFTPDMVTAVWGGNDKNQAIVGRQVTGGTVMAGIWQSYMQSYYAKVPTPVGQFTAPQHPFIEEPEAVHFLPSPAGIFDKILQIDVSGNEPQPAPQNLRSDQNEEPPVAPERTKKKKKKGGVGKFFKKVFDWL